MNQGDRREMANHPKVIIIGAGISGLSAANHLLQTGQTDLCILEGRNRLGGRVCTKRNGSETMELGAASIHGTKDNPIYDLACKHDLLQGLDPAACYQSLSNIGVSHAVFSACGGSVDEKLVAEVNEVYVHIMETATNKPKMVELARNSASPSSVGTYAQLEFQKYLDGCEDSNHTKLLKEKLFDWLQRVENIHSGCQTLHDLNLEDFGEYKVLEGPVKCPVPTGYDRIVQVLASNLSKNCIYFDHIVNEIQWNIANGSSATPTHPVQVFCENGECFHADHIIITIPLGVLKLSHQTLFNPSLPHEKVLAMEHLGFGICDKIFLEFEEPFWSGSQYSVNLLWMGPSTGTADRIVTDPTAGHFPSWVYRLFSFFTISPGSKILMTWVWGDAAIEMEQTALEKVGKLCLAVLKQFTGTTLPKLVNVHRTKWYTDPLSQGSYTYVATEARGRDIDTLASPLPCKEAVADTGAPSLQLLFAGEATHRLFYSTVHGAYISGIREANRIVANAPKVTSHV